MPGWGRAAPAAAAPPPRAAPRAPRRPRSPPPVRPATTPPSPAPPPPRGGRRTASPLPAPRFPLPLVGFGVALDAIIDAHEPAEPAEQRARDREQRPRPEPAVQQPPQGAEGEDGGREAEPHAHVRVALAEALGGAVLIVGRHEPAVTYALVKNFASKGSSLQPYVALGSILW